MGEVRDNLRISNGEELGYAELVGLLQFRCSAASTKFGVND